MKKKSFFTKTLKDEGKIEYSLNPGIVAYIMPKITSDLKVLAKNSYLFKDKEVDENIKDKKRDEVDGKDKGENNAKDDKKNRKKRNRKKNDKNKKSENAKKTVESTDDTRINNLNDFDIIINDDNSEEKNNINTMDKDDNYNATNCNKINNSQIINRDSEMFFDENKELNYIDSNHNETNRSATLLKKKRKNSYINKENHSDKEEKLNKSFELSSNNALNSKKEDSLLLNIALKENLLSINNKIDSIANIGIFINYINNNNLSDITAKKLDLIEKKIELKKKSIKADYLFLNNLAKTKEKIISIKIPEIQEKINLLQKNYRQFNELIELLLINKNEIENSNDKEDAKAKKALEKYRINYEKCQKIMEKVLSGVLLICKNYGHYEELINMLLADRNYEKKYLNMNGVLNVEDLRNMLKQILEMTSLDNNDMNNINNDNDSSKANKEYELILNSNQFKKLIGSYEKSD